MFIVSLLYSTWIVLTKCGHGYILTHALTYSCTCTTDLLMPSGTQYMLGSYSHGVTQPILPLPALLCDATFSSAFSVLMLFSSTSQRKAHFTVHEYFRLSAYFSIFWRWWEYTKKRLMSEAMVMRMIHIVTMTWICAKISSLEVTSFLPCFSVTGHWPRMLLVISISSVQHFVILGPPH